MKMTSEKDRPSSGILAHFTCKEGMHSVNIMFRIRFKNAQFKFAFFRFWTRFIRLLYDERIVEIFVLSS